MMNQFGVLTVDGKRWLTVVNIDRYDAFIDLDVEPLRQYAEIIDRKLYA